MRILVALVSVGLGFSLTACVVSRWNPDVYNGYKAIQAYQKIETIGRTDSIQRKRDAFECGVMNYNEGNLDGNVVYPGMTTQQVMERRIRIGNCMKSKGYAIRSPEDCTNRGRPTGFCN
ncbi:hypothetical protein ATCM_11520 [Stenotrophomonas sp. ATCM1_4]|nr:hypothetical protein ATCM_11520 [Stenotrophomonas sp. ATCM1_4]